MNSNDYQNVTSLLNSELHTEYPHIYFGISPYTYFTDGANHTIDYFDEEVFNSKTNSVINNPEELYILLSNKY